MKIYKTQEEVEKDIKDGVLNCQGEDVRFECSIAIEASIINALDINAWNINAWNINAWNINAGDINARDINARDIDAWNINAGDINARDINARDISYHASCLSYNSIECRSIKAKREKHAEPICLDGELVIKKDEEIKGKKVTIKLSGGELVSGELVE